MLTSWPKISTQTLQRRITSAIDCAFEDKIQLDKCEPVVNLHCERVRTSGKRLCAPKNVTPVAVEAKIQPRSVHFNNQHERV